MRKEPNLQRVSKKEIDEIKINAYMRNERDYNQMDALKYLVETGPDTINEWTEAGMYHILTKVILEGMKRYTKQELDDLLKQVSNN